MHYKHPDLYSTFLLIFLSTNAYCSTKPKVYRDDVEPTYEAIDIKKNDEWIQLQSGEFLVGKLIGSAKEEQSSYSQAISFDSAELGDQELKVKDVSLLHTSSQFRVRLSNGETHTGYLRIKDDMLTIIGSEQAVTIATSEIVTIHSLTTKETQRWKSDIFLGGNFSKGNTDELSINAELNAERTTVFSRTQLRYSGNLTKSSVETTANNHTADGSYDIYLKNQLFFRPVKLTVTSDKFQNIQYRANTSMQVGYFVVAQPDLEWDISVGPGYQYTRYSTVQEQDSKSENSPTVLFSSNLDYEINAALDFTHTYDMSWTSNNAGGVRHSNNFGFDLGVIDDLDFSIKLVWDYVSNPKVADTGLQPEKSDYKLSFGVTYEL